MKHAILILRNDTLTLDYWMEQKPTLMLTLGYTDALELLLKEWSQSKKSMPVHSSQLEAFIRLAVSIVGIEDYPQKIKEGIEIPVGNIEQRLENHQLKRTSKIMVAIKCIVRWHKK